MHTVQLTYPLPEATNADSLVLAIGEFDGVHLGHREVIGRAVERGSELHLPAAIMTFHPHPREVLGMDKYTQLLTPLAAKQKQLRELGVHTTYIVDFNESFMRVTPEQFVERMLIPMGVNTVFVGFDFTFGFKGAGTPDTLCDLARGRFAVEVIRPYLFHGEKVSSTQIRSFLLNGDVQEASVLLGRPYKLEGTVVHGDGRGRTIGFPTANIEVTDSYVIPARGVYAVLATVHGRKVGAVMNVGVKPTFDTGLLQPVLEAHLFDFSETIYGETIEVELLAFIRHERKFDSVHELISQIGKDADQARSFIVEQRSMQKL
ncbi:MULTISPECIES: bifunctional riboflavin kinase/FAD synthetase [unclassified Paenibacillus]|uniref:bifunctional riboflavin kinase/FAD synthetase n=1 Tax=unclassified Paenibacillus TaxID=185978 RepID=UPI001AE163BB|nr:MULTISPECIES: bifunctional riboflavin kinase/FAD synthetase [unclassified Paenibacillus]MBP1155959.1 riboflavin kinase/FMN adenylyltransferase [Paenibacillus sp. PvP091]MBP1168655.1 riboflavin kinase/FMN adenylyltransferase [Paenibacillus sp. PvR098]MBP2439683.1 riboflavin kinase/FMN adenylyltransferase [Paenibacillus sp. PvP052]